ncbi:BnaCnng36530D [Brassica napus]|uniref:BnaCnng36530D protein n=1 Tax=Brassica napus TaxID=3708 RepID=A0A078J9E2_BRANA|nr:BnaCnng36530D [Brassica napus]
MRRQLAIKDELDGGEEKSLMLLRYKVFTGSNHEDPTQTKQTGQIRPRLKKIEKIGKKLSIDETKLLCYPKGRGLKLWRQRKKLVRKLCGGRGKN